HPRCFVHWFAGAGIKPGVTFGETDDFSYNIVKDPVHIRDINATILHLMGMYQELFARFDPPFEAFDNSMLGPEFPAELELVSRFWFRCGYRPGIGAYLNFFLLREFITTHDLNYPPRFATFKSMARSFYMT